jgi:3',5'-cyclic AMP phosphodiesterase CpdA
MPRILHLSDPHFGAVDPAAAAAFLERAAVLAPDLTILSGDLTMRARRRELADAKAFADRLPQPLALIPGNHDIPAANHFSDRIFRPFDRFRRTFGPVLEPELVTGFAHVLCLNSSRAFGFQLDWSEGRLSRSQLARIGQTFAATPPDRLRILVLHHPLLELQIAGRAVVKPLAALMAAMETARVDLVMCGHFHRSQIHAAGLTDRWKSIISQAPTVCSTRLQGEPQGFHVFDSAGGRVEAAHHVFRDGKFVSAGRTRFSRRESGWNPARDP